MYKNLRVATLLPAYNEEKLITKTVTTLPDYIDKIMVIDDLSTDGTLKIAKDLAKKDPRVVVIHHEVNTGIGGAYVSGFEKSIELGMDLVVTMAGDAQCNPDYIKNMIDTLLADDLDYVKANRFVHLNDLKQMPKYRQVGNIIITLLTKFSSGYYSIFDSQNGYGVFRRKTLEDLPFEHIGRRYDYENTLLIALAIMGAKIKDEPVPALYGDEVSTIPVFKTTMRALKVVWKGFWQRIYYKYVVVNFHPIALFLFSGLALTLAGLAVGIYLVITKLAWHVSPSTGSTMLCVLPLIVGFQIMLTALIMDMNNENK